MPLQKDRPVTLTINGSIRLREAINKREENGIDVLADISVGCGGASNLLQARDT
jgi:hypothetical protein